MREKIKTIVATWLILWIALYAAWSLIGCKRPRNADPYRQPPRVSPVWDAEYDPYTLHPPSGFDANEQGCIDRDPTCAISTCTKGHTPCSSESTQ